MVPSSASVLANLFEATVETFGNAIDLELVVIVLCSGRDLIRDALMEGSSILLSVEIEENEKVAVANFEF